jgi:hypothetical protein
VRRFISLRGLSCTLLREKDCGRFESLESSGTQRFLTQEEIMVADLKRRAYIRKLKVACLSVLGGLCAPALIAEPLLPHLFSEHMVLQRNVTIPIWGWADPGEKISVNLAGRTAETVVGEDRRWKVAFAPMPAGGPFTLTIRGKRIVVIKDVMFGEVWVASGQSNMTYALSGATGADTEIPRAVNPLIRFFTVPKRISLAPQSDTLPANWEVCSPQTAKAFSAVSYFFARDLYAALNDRASHCFFGLLQDTTSSVQNDRKS